MAYDNSNCAHMWVHDQRMKSDKSRFYESGHLSFSEVSAMSYSTIIAQCLDRKKHVFLVIDKNLTTSTGGHIRDIYSAIPKDWTKIRTHWESSYRYDNVGFLKYNEEFDNSKRCDLVTHLIMDVYRQVKEVLSSKSKDAGKIDLVPIKYIYDLSKLYKDVSLEKWLKKSYKSLNQYEFGSSKESKKVWERCRAMVLAILECQFTCGEKEERYGPDDKYVYKFTVYECKDEDWKRKVTNATFGDGTWEEYLRRTEYIDKARATVEKLNAIRSYLLIPKARSFQNNPQGYIGSNQLKSMFKSKEGIKSLLDIKKRTILNIRNENEESARKVRIRAAMNRARKFLGANLLSESEVRYGSFHDIELNSVVSNGVTIYSNTISEKSIRLKYGIPDFVYKLYTWCYGNDDKLQFGTKEYESFCSAPDKKQWRKRFWQLCELKMRRKRGELLYQLYNNRHGYVIELDEEDSHIMNEYVLRKEKYDRDRERRIKLEEEARKREYQRKLETIEAYKKDGIEGVRKIWYEHLGGIPSEINMSGSELYYGGNVLLRFASQNGYIETSKGIRIPFSDAHRYWEIIKKWHDGGKFSKVKMAGYTVESFDNGILVAGCHEIAYQEMERMYNELCKREAA